MAVSKNQIYKIKIERFDYMKLYHGTCDDSAQSMLKNGWRPNDYGRGNNWGSPKFLYLTTSPYDAEWFAIDKGCNSVLRVDIPKNDLHIDPDDGIFSYEYWSAIKNNDKKSAKKYLEMEFNTMKSVPAKFVAYKPIKSNNFSICKKISEKWIC